MQFNWLHINHLVLLNALSSSYIIMYVAILTNGGHFLSLLTGSSVSRRWHKNDVNNSINYSREIFLQTNFVYVVNKCILHPGRDAEDWSFRSIINFHQRFRLHYSQRCHGRYHGRSKRDRHYHYKNIRALRPSWVCLVVGEDSSQ